MRVSVSASPPFPVAHEAVGPDDGSFLGLRVLRWMLGV